MTAVMPSRMNGHRRPDRAREIVEGLSDAFLSLDADWRFTDCNRAIERFLNRSRRELLGRVIWDIAGVSMDSPFAQMARRVSTSHEAEEAEVVHRFDEDERLLSVRVFPLEGGIGAVWRDITEVRAAELKLAESEARYRELAHDVPAAAWLSRANGGLEFVNQAMVDALGRPREDLLGYGWMEAIDPADRESFLAATGQAQSSHGSFQYEGRFRHVDGDLRVVDLYGRPRFTGSGDFNGHAGTATDVTKARAAERRQKLLIDELNHRVKNTLATVQSLILQTLRGAGVPKEVQTLLVDRLMALSAAHNVLTREHWEWADLDEVAREAVKPHAQGEQIALAGPPTRLAPNTAVILSMALHELSTNALKYGALSTPYGRVRLSWKPSDDGVDLEWREVGGPPASAPFRRGFGSRLLNQGLAGELGEPAELTFAPEGLVCRIHAPLGGDERPAPLDVASQ